MALRIAARGHVKNDARFALLSDASLRELNSELRFADAGRTNDDGQSARQQTAAEEFIELRDASRESGHQGRC
jgi:hypothetical protein